jgi:hypothetical protein
MLVFPFTSEGSKNLHILRDITIDPHILRIQPALLYAQSTRWHVLRYELNEFSIGIISSAMDILQPFVKIYTYLFVRALSAHCPEADFVSEMNTDS